MRWARVFGACFLLTTACNTGNRPAPAKLETGVASWYGVPFNGRLTANGEIFDMEKLTAAHRTLAFGSVVRVRKQADRQMVEVRINDRGPFVKNRIIDLSRGAAQKIQMSGTAEVDLEILSTPTSRAADNFAVQVAMTPDLEEANRLRTEMERQYGTASLALRAGDPPMWRVLVGIEATEESAQALAARIGNLKGDVFVVRIDPQ